MNDVVLEIRNLSKTYRTLFKEGTHAVKNLSLEVEKGEIFGLLGPNGAGKTTLILTILGLLNKDKGKIKIFGKSCEDLDVKRRISYLPENPSFNFPQYLTASEYLDLHASLKGISQEDKSKQVSFLLTNLELADRKDDRISKFSKGMLQRLNIGQAFLGEPDLLFLDEPVLGLDPTGIAQVRKLIMMFKDRGKTFFINSHMLSEVEKTCDRVGIMVEGELKKILSMKELADSIDSVVIKISNIDSVAKKISHLGEIKDNTLFITVKNEDDIEKVTTEIFKKGGRITSITPQFKNLEQFFIEVLKKDDMDNS